MDTYLIDSIVNPALFDEEEILSISLTGSMKDLLRDQSAEPQYYPLQLSYGKENSIDLSVKVKTRGNFRRLIGNCSYLPLMIKFNPSPSLDNSIFQGQQTLKLVMPCANERFVIREWLVYKMYNLINPYSFKTRLVKVSLNATDKKGKPNVVFAFLLEDEDHLANRLGMTSTKKIVVAEKLERENYLKMTLFQYLIGNTDWSIRYRQNIKFYINEERSDIMAVPYDFDFSGLVEAPYAKPPVELRLKSTKERRYRGFCIADIKEYDQVITHYRAVKSEIYDLISNCEFLEEKDINSSRRFVDGFYGKVDNVKRLKKDLLYPCNPHGTGAIEISGLKN